MPKAIIAPYTLAGLPGEHLNVLKKAGFDLVYPAKPVLMSEADMLAQMGGVAAAVAGSPSQIPSTSFT